VAELRWGAATHEGRMRAQNEDHHFAGEGLFVVADGMGGHLAGEVASEIAVDRLRHNLPPEDENSLDDVVAAITEANTEIYDGSLHNPDQAGMGTTITAIAVVEDHHDGQVFGIANVGDSRSYVMRHGRLRQVTIDHSFVQELVAEGAISREEARHHPRRNIVTRALGIEPAVRVDSWTMPIFQGDRFVLCSDGLVDEVADADIAAVLLEHPDPGDAAQALVDAANEAGGRDNITVVVVDVLEGDEAPDPTEEFDVVPLWTDDDLDTTAETEIVADPLPDDDHDTLTITDQADPATATITDPAEADAQLADPESVADAVPTLPAAEPVAPPAAEVTSVPPPAPVRRRRRKGGGLFAFLAGVGFAAVIVLGFAILAAWARSGYYVQFAGDKVAIYQGHEGGVLWFQPTIESYGPYTRDELTPDSIVLVEQSKQFESLESASRFVSERIVPLSAANDTSITDRPITTIPPATPAPPPDTSGPGG